MILHAIPHLHLYATFTYVHPSRKPSASVVPSVTAHAGMTYTIYSNKVSAMQLRDPVPGIFSAEMMVGSLQSSFLLAYRCMLSPLPLNDANCLPSAMKSLIRTDVQHGCAIALEPIGPSDPARSSLSGDSSSAIPGKMRSRMHLCAVLCTGPRLLALDDLQQVV